MLTARAEQRMPARPAGWRPAPVPAPSSSKEGRARSLTQQEQGMKIAIPCAVSTSLDLLAGIRRNDASVPKKVPSTVRRNDVTPDVTAPDIRQPLRCTEDRKWWWSEADMTPALADNMLSDKTCKLEDRPRNFVTTDFPQDQVR